LAALTIIMSTVALWLAKSFAPGNFRSGEAIGDGE